MIAFKSHSFSPMSSELSPNHASPRSESYKNKDKNPRELRRRRSETIVELRKQRRDDNTDRRRNISLYDNWSDGEDIEEELENDVNINEVLMGLKAGNVWDMPSKSIRQLRLLIPVGRQPNTDEEAELMRHLLSDDMAVKLIGCLSSNECSMGVLYEVVALLAQLCSGGSDEAMVLVKQGIVANLMPLLSYDSFGVMEESVLALTYIWNCGQELRELINGTEFVRVMAALIESETSVSPSKYDRTDGRVALVRTISWSLMVMCQQKNATSYQLAIALISYFIKLLNYCDDEVKANVLKALSSTTEPLATLSETGSAPNLELVHTVVSNGLLLESIIENLSSKDENTFYAMRVIGNLISWGESYTQIVLQTRILAKFDALLQHHNPKVQREAAFTVSNITAGNYCQIQAVIDAKIMPIIVELLYMGEYRTQVEASHVLLNITAIGSTQQIAYIINIDNNVANMDSIDAMATLLTSIDAKTVETCLKFYNNLLLFAKRVKILNQVIQKCELSSASYHIEELQNNRNTGVAVLATHLIDTYFSRDLSLEEDVLLNTSLDSPLNQTAPNFSF